MHACTMRFVQLCANECVHAGVPIHACMHSSAHACTHARKQGTKTPKNTKEPKNHHHHRGRDPLQTMRTSSSRPRAGWRQNKCMCMHAFIHVQMCKTICASVLAFMLVCMCACVQACVLGCAHACVHVFRHVHFHACVNARMHACR